MTAKQWPLWSSGGQWYAKGIVAGKPNWVWRRHWTLYFHALGLRFMIGWMGFLSKRWGFRYGTTLDLGHLSITVRRNK